jgi:O-antigen ligase
LNDAGSARQGDSIRVKSMTIQSLGLQDRGSDAIHRNAPFLMLIGVWFVLLGLLLSQVAPPALVFGAIGLVVSCVVVSAQWPYGALLILCVASVMPRITVEIGGWNARPEHCASVLVILVLLFRRVSIEGQRIKLTGTDYWIAAYVVWNYISSALMSPDPKLTLRWALLNNLVVLPYFLIRFVVRDERTLRWLFKAFLTVGVLECAYAAMCFASRHLFGTSFGTEMDQYAVGLGGAYGTQYEPNLLGSYAGCLTIMLLVFYFLSGRKPRWVVLASTVSLAALLVSLSRAAFLGFGLVLLVLMFMGMRAGLVSAKKLLPIGLIMGLFIAPFAATSGKNLLSRLVGLGAGVENDPDSMARIVSWTAALTDIAQHPIAGNGTASFQLLADAKELPLLGDRPWVGNSPLRIVHDTGVIGLLLMAVVLLAIVRDVRRAIAGRGTGTDIIIVLTSGCIVYAVAFMATEGTMLSFFWVHVGLLASACSVARIAPV